MPTSKPKRGAHLFRHGHSRGKSPEYAVWKTMKQRCENKNKSDYERYGGRGITVCARWRADFTAFLEDMGQRPSPHHSLERIDNGGNYEPGNCRWATAQEQALNRRTNHTIEHNGERLALSEWEHKIGLKKGTLRYRVQRGWPLSRALNPRDQRRRTGGA